MFVAFKGTIHLKSAEVNAVFNLPVLRVGLTSLCLVELEGGHLGRMFQLSVATLTKVAIGVIIPESVRWQRQAGHLTITERLAVCLFPQMVNSALAPQKGHGSKSLSSIFPFRHANEGWVKVSSSRI